ncbi:ABC transporter ATP-binding protein [Arenibaculum pallidiluteum]
MEKGGSAILSGLDLSVRPGELLGLVGPNGAGKSTLLRVLAGIEPPTAGAVLYDGARSVGGPALARRLAYLPQGGEVNWSVTVEDAVALGRLPHRGLDTARDAAAIAAAMAATGVAALKDRRIDTLSGGERMRTLLARALAVEAEILLADEPIAALDPASQLDAMALLRRLARAGTGVVAVLHDLSLAVRWCDRLVLMATGSVVAEGAPSAVLDARNLAEIFGIEALRTEWEGQPVVVPWRRAERTGRTGPG